VDATEVAERAMPAVTEAIKSRLDNSILFSPSRAPLLFTLPRPRCFAILRRIKMHCLGASPVVERKRSLLLSGRLASPTTIRKAGRMRTHHLTPLLAALFVTACSVLPNEPTAADLRSIRLESDAAKTVTVRDGMVFYNGSPGTPRTKGIRFPSGVYALEGEDDNYWYLRAPAPLEFRIFRAGTDAVVDDRKIAGGIMIGKSLMKAPPAGGYIDDDGSTHTDGSAKIMVWKLGSELFHEKGKSWAQSF
jgi:hypothetical protein